MVHAFEAMRHCVQVIHRGCKDALEESKGVQAEYRNLKVALTETEANVKYMMQHCSNESSFAISAESGTEVHPRCSCAASAPASYPRSMPAVAGLPEHMCICQRPSVSASTKSSFAKLHNRRDRSRFMPAPT